MQSIDDASFYLKQAIQRAEIRILHKRAQILDAYILNLHSKKFYVSISDEMMQIKPEIRHLDELIESDREFRTFWQAFKVKITLEKPIIFPEIIERIEAILAIKSCNDLFETALEEHKSQTLPSHISYWTFVLIELAERIFNQHLDAFKPLDREILQFFTAKKVDTSFFAGKRLREDEFPFSPLPISLQNPEIKIPDYFCKYRAVYEWNRYNQVHYSSDNPPPRKIVRYEFYIRYPGLSSSQTVPKWRLESGNLVFEAAGFCSLIFPSIRKGEWDRSERHGFVSLFDDDVLTLCFSFKHIHYRIR
jgi:hypothetical protein